MKLYAVSNNVQMTDEDKEITPEMLTEWFTIFDDHFNNANYERTTDSTHPNIDWLKQYNFNFGEYIFKKLEELK